MHSQINLECIWRKDVEVNLLPLLFALVFGTVKKTPNRDNLIGLPIIVLLAKIHFFFFFSGYLPPSPGPSGTDPGRQGFIVRTKGWRAHTSVINLFPALLDSAVCYSVNSRFLSGSWMSRTLLIFQLRRGAQYWESPIHFNSQDGQTVHHSKLLPPPSSYSLWHFLLFSEKRLGVPSTVGTTGNVDLQKCFYTLSFIYFIWMPVNHHIYHSFKNHFSKLTNVFPMYLKLFTIFRMWWKLHFKHFCNKIGLHWSNIIVIIRVIIVNYNKNLKLYLKQFMLHENKTY